MGDDLMICVCYKMVYGLRFGDVCLGFGAVIWVCDVIAALGWLWLGLVFGLLVWVTFRLGFLVRRLRWLILWVCVLV